MALRDKKIVIGVAGGIAAYKAAEIVRLLTARGAIVKVMMTPNAREFITPLTLQTLSGNPVATETFSLTEESEIGHIRLADSADAILIAPATADLIAKAAVGIADDIVTTVLLAAQCPIAFAPSMNLHMYGHPALKENLAKLATRGATIVEPDEGFLACGYEGKGRLADPAAIVDEIDRMLSPNDLSAERILVSAGPTQEEIDPVRFVSNRSSGKMGFAIAKSARRRGAAVRMVAGPSALATPRGVERIDTTTASSMIEAVRSNFPWCSALIMAAAIADFRPAHPAKQKIKKNPRGMAIELAPIADAMPALAARKGNRILVGFAAESRDLEANAMGKLAGKKLDFIVANDITLEGAGFGVDTNIVTLLGTDGSKNSYPKMTKDEVAEVILDRIVDLRKTGKSRGLRIVR